MVPQQQPTTKTGQDREASHQKLGCLVLTLVALGERVELGVVEEGVVAIAPDQRK